MFYYTTERLDIQMTQTQKEQIAAMRRQGLGYGKIAASLGLSQNSIKSVCRRNNLISVTPIRQRRTACGACEECGKALLQIPETKKKRFCSDKCRMAWWAAHPEAVNRKAVYHFTCPVCGASFASYGNANRKYCSRSCYAQSRRRRHE